MPNACTRTCGMRRRVASGLPVGTSLARWQDAAEQRQQAHPPRSFPKPETEQECNEGTGIAPSGMASRTRFGASVMVPIATFQQVGGTCVRRPTRGERQGTSRGPRFYCHRSLEALSRHAPERSGEICTVAARSTLGHRTSRGQRQTTSPLWTAGSPHSKRHPDTGSRRPI